MNAIKNLPAEIKFAVMAALFGVLLGISLVSGLFPWERVKPVLDFFMSILSLDSSDIPSVALAVFVPLCPGGARSHKPKGSASSVPTNLRDWTVNDIANAISVRLQKAAYPSLCKTERERNRFQSFLMEVSNTFRINHISTRQAWSLVKRMFFIFILVANGTMNETKALTAIVEAVEKSRAKNARKNRMR